MKRKNQLIPDQIDDRMFEAWPISWNVGSVSVKEHEGITYFMQNPTWRKGQDDLSTEFYLHELMDVDAREDDLSDILRFISEWGMPFSTYRNPAFGFGSDYDATIKSISETELLICGRDIESVSVPVDRLRELLKADRTACGCFHAAPHGNFGIISVSEAILTVRQLQRAVSDMQNYMHNVIDGIDASEPDLSSINNGAASPLTISTAYIKEKGFIHGNQHFEFDRSNPSLHSRGLLTSAICNQIIETVRSPHKWRECAYRIGEEGKCGKIFKHQNPDGSTNYSKTNYCCSKHSHGMSQDMFRERKLASKEITND